MVSGLPRTPRKTAVSMTTQLAPMRTAPLSALTTAPNPIEVLAPIETSPQIVAFGAIRADGSMAGCFPLCSRIMGPPSKYVVTSAGIGREGCKAPADAEPKRLARVAPGCGLVERILPPLNLVHSLPTWDGCRL